uniref:Putative otefin n=1 Tax=Culex tarsalis TaxID=7177 RepID=A0A1Q3EZT0_CULTA
MENFEDLTNDQIRLKLLEYGLPNIPVTSTSRKVLIKKLKNHVENANSKVRRETIHVAKYSSDEDVEEQPVKKTQSKKEVNRRATIGGPAAKLSQTLPVKPQLPPPSKPAVEKGVDSGSKRRSGRLTPVLSKDDATPVVAAPKEPMIIENSDDEDEAPLTQLQSRDRKSKSKSPSLSRAEMVTTSYIHQKAEAAAKPAIPEEMEIDLTESTDEIMDEAPPAEPAPVVIRPPVTPSRESRYKTTNNASSSITSKRTTIAGAGPPASEALSSSFGRPSMTATTTTSYTSYSSPAPKQRDELKLDPTDSPYLSEFTKRLSRLKAESTQGGGTTRDYPVRRTIGYAASPVATGGGTDYVQSRLAAARGQKPAAAADGKGEIRASLRQVILALDQKYSFKKLFYTLIVILIVVFLFVFFFM